MEINEIEDQNAKEIFISLEECIRYEETGMDELLASISSPGLKELLVERSASGEFSINSQQLVADGIKKIKGKRLERRQEEIIVKLRGLKKQTRSSESSAGGPDQDSIQNRDSPPEIKELLAEKMRIDNELHQLKQGR